MKKFLSFFALSAIVLGMASCGDGNEPDVNNAPEGAINGKFTVDEGKQVYFAKGNLRASYDGSEWKWLFANNQWDHIGKASGNIAIDDEGKIPAKDTVDLFGWSTESNNFGISKSMDNSVYAGDFKDWGTNIGNGWCTLSEAEWYYLFFTRDDAAKLFGLGSVNGIKGVIILPDDWKLPEGVPAFNPSAEKGMVDIGISYSNTTDGANNYNDNTYIGQDWVTMEKAGAVFLPAAGWREGVEVTTVGLSGNYWSLTLASGISYFRSAQKLNYVPRSLSTGTIYCYAGCSVRLVKPVE